MEEKIPRQARAESDAQAGRAEGQQVGNDWSQWSASGPPPVASKRSGYKHLPVSTGMAFVLVMHLDPKHESILPELLAKATQLPVSEVKDGMPVAPDTLRHAAQHEHVD